MLEINTNVRLAIKRNEKEHSYFIPNETSLYDMQEVLREMLGFVSQKISEIEAAKAKSEEEKPSEQPKGE